MQNERHETQRLTWKEIFKDQDGEFPEKAVYTNITLGEFC